MRSGKATDSGGLRLICPGLLGPLPALPQPFPETPVIDRLLARADRIPVVETDPLALLCEAFGLIEDQDLPSAALCLLAEDPEADVNAFWLHADPVHLRADRDRLLLFAGAGIAPDRAEADALVDLFNRHFKDDGLYLAAPTPGRWYLRADRGPDLRTPPLHRVLGRPIAPEMFAGPDASQWMRFQNEAQMLFHGSAVNRARERRGRPAISGVWTWGGGYPPRVAGDLPELVVGDHPLVIGLARRAGLRHRTLEQWYGEPLVSGKRVLLYWDVPWRALLEQDLAAWGEALMELESGLVRIDAQRRETGPFRLDIDPCQGMRFQVSSARSWFRLGTWRSRGLRELLTVGRNATGF